MEEFFSAINSLITSLIVTVIVIGTIEIGILVLIIKAFIRYAAKKNAEAFHYDELARKIAGEIIRTQINYANYQQQQQIRTPPKQPDQPINQPANQQRDAAPEPRRYRPPGL